MGALLRRARRRPVLSAGLLLTTMAGILFFRVIVGGEAFINRDVLPFFYPMKEFLARSVRAGEFPLWNPWVLNGVPFFASLQPGHLYPGSALLYLVPFPAAYNLLVVLHFPLAGLGLLLLLRRWGHGFGASLLGGIAFMLGGYLVSVAGYPNNLQTVAWIPWLFLLWDRFLGDGRLRDLIGFALVAGVAFLGGEPQMLGMGLVLLFLHGLLRIERKDPGRGLQLGAFLGAGTLAAALVAVQLLPFADLAGESVRGFDSSLAEAARYSLRPSALVELLLAPPLQHGPFNFTTRFLPTPEVPWLLSLYPGVAVVGFAALGLAQRTASRRRLFWGGTAIAGLLLALGRHAPLFPALFELIPPLRPFRYPEKFYFLPALAAAVLAASGFEAWKERRLRRAWVPFALLVGLFGLLLALLVAGRFGGGGIPAALCERLEALACSAPLTAGRLYALKAAAGLGVGAVLVLVVRARDAGRLRPAGAGALAVAAAAVDLLAAGVGVNATVEAEAYQYESWAAEVLAETGEPRGAYRYRGTPLRSPVGTTLRGARDIANLYLVQQGMQPSLGMLYRHPTQDGAQGLEMREVSEVRGLETQNSGSLAVNLLRAMNVKFYMDPHPAAADSLPGLRLHAFNPLLRLAIWRVPDPLPRAYTVGRYRVVEGRLRALQLAMVRAFPLRRAAAVDRPPPGEIDPAAEGRLLEAEYGIDRVDLTVTTTGPQLLVLTDRFSPGWSATVDGEPAEILRANGYFRAVRVPRGESRVAFRFRPPLLRTGLAISLVALLLSGALFAAGPRLTRSA